MSDRHSNGPTNFEDVGLFHHRFGLDHVNGQGAGPREFDPELMEFRVNFMLEELGEFIEAIGGKVVISDIVVAGSRSLRVEVPEGAKIDHPQAFDALLDLAYVVFGTAHLMGYPWEAGWAAVQHANMQKVRARPDGSDSVRKSSFDVVKPEGWKPPDIGLLLERYGWPCTHTEEHE